MRRVSLLSDALAAAVPSDAARSVMICDNGDTVNLPACAMQPHSTLEIDAATRTAVDIFINRLAPRFAVREAILFGSRARGDARPDSDADLAVVLRGAPAPFMETKLRMADAAFDAMLESGIRVQPLPLWDADRNAPDRWLNPELLRNIERRGIRVWQTPAL